MTDFDKIIDRHNTRSIKWDFLEEKYGDAKLDSMWVADSDFEVAKPIRKAIKRRAEHGIFGYTMKTDDFYNSIIRWCEKRHGWKIEKDWIVYTPGVVSAINWAVQLYTEPGDKVIIQPPVYYPFFSAVKNNGRELIENTLVNNDGHYEMDFNDLLSKIDEKTKLLILCSPHNPVGRVWSEEELQILTDICIDHGIRIVSDEIHSDLIMPGNRHIVTSSISDEVQAITLTCMAPSKTFNVAGLDTAVAIIPDEQMRREFKEFQKGISVAMANVFGIEAFIAAYDKGEKWLEKQLEYINGNYRYFRKFIRKKIPQLKVGEMEGTYLVWLDCRALNMNNEDLDKFFVEEVGVALNSGSGFGEAGNGFMRINIATPKENIERMLKNLEKAVNKL